MFIDYHKNTPATFTYLNNTSVDHWLLNGTTDKIKCIFYLMIRIVKKQYLHFYVTKMCFMWLISQLLETGIWIRLTLVWCQLLVLIEHEFCKQVLTRKKFSPITKATQYLITTHYINNVWLLYTSNDRKKTVPLLDSLFNR